MESLDHETESSREQVEKPNVIPADISTILKNSSHISYLQSPEKATCRQLADAIYTKLPRELRNHIYTQLTSGKPSSHHRTRHERILVLDTAFPSSAAGSGDPNEDEWQACQFHWSTKDCTKYERLMLEDEEEKICIEDRVCTQHQLTGRIFDSAYVGEAVALEAAETYYTTNTFHIHRSNPGRALYRLLTCKDPRFDIVPHTLIRNICIDIRLRNFIPSTRWSAKESRDERRKLNYLHRMLMNSFALVERKTRLQVHFIVRCNFTPHFGKGASCQNEWSLLNMVEALREPVYTLMHSGARVALHYSDGRDVVLDRTRIFHLDAGEWRREWEGHIRQWNVYRPDEHYIFRQERAVRDGKSFKVEIEEMLAHIEGCRQRWGYDSWLALVNDEHHNFPVDAEREMA